MYVPLLIHRMVLFVLFFGIESIAPWTVVKLQHPLWSTHNTDVERVSGGGKVAGRVALQLTMVVSL
jgi:hypothetical protein